MAASVEIERLKESLRAVDVVRATAEEEEIATRAPAADAQARAISELCSRSCFIPLFFLHFTILFVGLEEELDAVRREVTDLQWCLGEVEDQCEALEDGVLAVFHVVEPRAPLRVDQLHALPTSSIRR